MSAAYCHVDKPNSPGCFCRMPKGHVNTYHVCDACGESWPGGPVKAPQNAVKRQEPTPPCQDCGHDASTHRGGRCWVDAMGDPIYRTRSLIACMCDGIA